LNNITGTFNNRKLEERFIERPTPSSTTQDSCEPSRLEENDATYHSTNKTHIVAQESFISRVVITKDFLSLFVFTLSSLHAGDVTLRIVDHTCGGPQIVTSLILPSPRLMLPHEGSEI
jgi:hypothetical protein